ncbi:hypothetical protein F5Y03DRAFT_349420 [Xylaria venustula]|nr:hypothetical protein F5Y03DRAFT_349420 [Xylaria venustula]
MRDAITSKVSVVRKRQKTVTSKLKKRKRIVDSQLKKRLNLRRQKTAMALELTILRELQETNDSHIMELQNSLRTKREAAGVSERLWREYESFCKELQPDEYRERRSFEWNESYNDSYIKYDPKFTAVNFYAQSNWRCECVATYTKAGTPVGYQVEYCALVSLEDAGLEGTWGRAFPRLYDYALRDSQKGSIAALEMLITLPDRDSCCREGWAFEFEFMESRSSHPNPSKRWGFRTSHDCLFPAMNKNKRTRIIEKYGLPFDINN